MRWSVCIFAHNEERLLPRCLGALLEAAGDADCQIHVLENGSTDHTARVAKALAAADPRIHVHELLLGDKSNAWNEYVHRLAPAADTHVFIDGDVRPDKDSLRALEAALRDHPEAYAAAALPATGRSRRGWAARLIGESYISGNLYALPERTLAEFRARPIHLPVGAFGEDGLLSYIFVTDFRGGRDDSHRDRIVVADDAHFVFDSLTLNARDIDIYRRRMLRYSQRYFQNEILYEILKARGLRALPTHVREIFTRENLAPFLPRLNPRYFFSDRAVLKRLRAEAQDAEYGAASTRPVPSS
jgi:glycosyltransferase involved in cell wall biosynthesis